MQSRVFASDVHEFFILGDGVYFLYNMSHFYNVGVRSGALVPTMVRSSQMYIRHSYACLLDLSINSGIMS